MKKENGIKRGIQRHIENKMEMQKPGEFDITY